MIFLVPSFFSLFVVMQLRLLVVSLSEFTNFTQNIIVRLYNYGYTIC